MKPPSTTSRPLVLLQPRGTCRNFTRSGSLYPPLGLCQLAAMASPDDVVVIDADGENLSDEQTLKRVLSYSPRLVGMTVTVRTHEIVEFNAKRLLNHGIPTILGGPQATVAPMSVLDQCPSVIGVFRGEGEVIIPELLKRLETSRPLRGLIGLQLREEDNATSEIARIGDLAGHPFPRLQGLPIESYWCPDAKRTPMTTFITAPGCPHRCGFCSSPITVGRKLRRRPVKEVIEHLAELKARGIREISFVDDVFSIDRKRALKLCKGMTDLGLTWFCNARADQLDPELAQAMRRAGCHQVYLGFESGSPKILRAINKDASIEQLVKGAKTLRKAGIALSLGFVLGLPGEDDQTVNATIEVARSLRPDRVQFTCWTPLPGSPLYQSGLERDNAFHATTDSQLEAWRQQCYEVASREGWGQPSW